MATTEAPRFPSPATAEGPQLKHLGFVRVAVLQVYITIIHLYFHLKEKSGPFKGAIESIESRVLSAVGPVLSRVNADGYLNTVDSKVDETLQYADARVPEPWKTKALSAYEVVAKTLPEKAHEAIDMYKAKGAAGTLGSFLDYFIPILLSYIQALWVFFVTLPVVATVAAAAQPHVIYSAQQVNILLAKAKKSDIGVVKSVAEALPAIPVEKLKKSE